MLPLTMTNILINFEYQRIIKYSDYENEILNSEDRMGLFSYNFED
jgi:hypothetical protein